MRQHTELHESGAQARRHALMDPILAAASSRLPSPNRARPICPVQRPGLEQRRGAAELMYLWKLDSMEHVRYMGEAPHEGPNNKHNFAQERR